MIEEVHLTFPPLLTGHQVSAQQSPLEVANQADKKDEFTAGDLYLSESAKNFRMALILESEVELIRCAEILYVVMVAFGDTAGSSIPPKIGITYRWPNQILLNDGKIGFADSIVSEKATNSCSN